MLLVAIAQGQVALLLEDLAGGGRLRAVGHRVRRDDAHGDSGSEPGALGNEGGPRVLEEWIGHDRIVPVTWESIRGSYTPGEYPRPVPRGVVHMPIEKDPVCGMDVDTTATDLKLEHDGTTYWFCGKGCYLEFRDDPERFLDPDYEPSM
jgi:YHS domain-containing protein